MTDTKYAYAEEVCMGTELLHVFETEEARDAWLRDAREPEWYLGGRAIHLVEGASAELSDKARTVRHYAELEYKRRTPIETTDACSAGCPEHYLDLGRLGIVEHLDEVFLQAHSAMARCIAAMHRYAPTYDNNAALGPIEEVIYDRSFKVVDDAGPAIVEIKVRHYASDAFPDWMLEKKKVQRLFSVAREEEGVVYANFYSDGVVRLWDVDEVLDALEEKTATVRNLGSADRWHQKEKAHYGLTADQAYLECEWPGTST